MARIQSRRLPPTGRASPLASRGDSHVDVAPDTPPRSAPLRPGSALSAPGSAARRMDFTNSSKSSSAKSEEAVVAEAAIATAEKAWARAKRQMRTRKRKR